jgi:diguanylate cyclase (GGDEF)-like protein
MKLNYRIVFIGFVFAVLYAIASLTYVNYVEKNQLAEKYLDISRHINMEVKTLINEKKEAILLISLSLSENENIKELLLTKDLNKLNLQPFSQKLKAYSSLHNTWFQVLTSDGTSLYRSWTDKNRDSVVNSRSDIAKIIHNPQVFSTISVGKYDLSFKSIVPIFNKNNFIGLVETIAKFNSISKKIEESGYENILLVDPKYKNQLNRVESKRFVDNYYIANNNADPYLVNLLKKDPSTYINIDKYIVKEGKLFTVFNIEDINKKSMAHFILTKDLNTIDVSEVINKKITLTSILALIFIFVGGILYYLYFINYKQFLQQQKTVLQESIDAKTKELQLKSESLKFQAEHDALTNLPNRVLFLDRLKESLKAAKRGSCKHISVVFLDLDRFKEINDTYGHEVGDKLLKLVTVRLKNKLREEDTIARLGGDEFILLLKNLNQQNIINVIDKIIKTMEEPFSINEIEIYTTFSIGISSYPEDGNTSDELIRNADTAMYKAKDNGKNNYHFYNAEMTKIAQERMQLDKELRKALLNNEFIAYFQPKIDAKNMKIVGLESLVRWMHPTKGLIYPDTFIPFAEETGLIDKIDNYMMKASMQQVLEWQKKGIECGKVSINLSSRQLASKTYLQKLKETIKSVGFQTQYLEIEITETHIMADPKYAMEILHKIRDLGISISIDDFGTGYSSLAYLKKLPITKLKIDRSFVVDIPGDKEDVAIVRTIISLAKNLGLDLIAEGAETKEQVACLVEEGCNNIQGYYFSKPLSKEACEDFLLNFG